MDFAALYNLVFDFGIVLKVVFFWYFILVVDITSSTVQVLFWNINQFIQMYMYILININGSKIYEQ